MPGAPASSATSASLTTSVRACAPIRRMMPATITESSGRSTPAIPRQMAAGTMSARADRFGHHIVQHLLDLQFAGGLKIRPRSSGLGDERAVLVRQVAHRLGAARVDTQHVNHASVILSASAYQKWRITIDTNCAKLLDSRSLCVFLELPPYVRRWLPVAAAVALLALTPTVPQASSVAPASRGRARRNPRALGPQNVARLDRINHGARPTRRATTGSTRSSCRSEAAVMRTSRSGLEPRAADLQRQPRDLRSAGHRPRAGARAGLRVHAWVNVNLVSSAADLPIAPTHLVHRHPEWLMVPRDLVQELSRVPEESPAYVGKLARWTRAQTTAATAATGTQPARASQQNLEGLYTSPHPSRGRRSHQRRRPRSRHALRGRRRPPGLRALPDRTLRLQPRRHSRLPRRRPAAARRGRAARGRRPGGRGPARVSGHVSRPSGKRFASHA